MRKITDFIVNHRILVFITFLILTIISIFLSTKVNINRDISKYLPSDSEVRIGMDIMEEEFGEIPSSTLNIMFHNLTDIDKEDIYNELKSIPNVEVSYDNTIDHNKDGYTLYTLNLDKSKSSKEASDLYEEINTKYQDYEYYLSGDIDSENKEILPLYIVVIAIFCALIILIIMCDSYLEPFLFLFAILLSVLLNKGTNIIFPSISEITSSISAILQLALSMDYSIMLMNRYKNEKLTAKDDLCAMKNALYDSFKAISSSSVTTIVGLIALVFMSFTIGRDLGLVLAKGVLFSLLSIFTTLPALILMFDKLIEKTKKKSPNIKLDKLGKFTYKFRYFGISLFILIFIISYLLKGNLNILYTDSETDKVSKIFNTNNQIALIYDKKEEDLIQEYCQNFKGDEKVEALCYGNTINEKLTYDQLNSKLEELGSDVTIDDYLIKLVYYSYYNQDENNQIALNNLLNFIKNKVYSNDNMNSHITKKVKNDIETLSQFTNKDSINKKRSEKELATTFDIDNIHELLIYYNSLNNNTKLTIKEFLNYMINYVSKSEYQDNIDTDTLDKLNKLNTYTDEELITEELTSSKMAATLGIDTPLVDSLYLYYINNNEINIDLTIHEFTTFLINYVLNDNNYNSKFTPDMKNNITLINNFSDQNLINKKIDIDNMSSLFNIDKELVKKVYLLYYMNHDDDSTYSVASLSLFLTAFSDESFVGLKDLLNNPELLQDQTLYTASMLSQKLNIPDNTLYRLYAMINYSTNNTKTWSITPADFINTILSNDDVKKTLDSNTLNNLETLSFVIDSTINNKSYTYKKIANIFNLSSSDTKDIYSLYIDKKMTMKISPLDFISFIIDHQNDQLLSSINNDTIKDLELLVEVMNSTLNNKLYSDLDMGKLLNIDSNKITLLYSIYNIDYEKKSISLSYQEFVNFLLNNIINNKDYSNKVTKDKVNKINTIKKVIDNSLNNYQYNNKELSKILKVLSNDIDTNLIEVIYIYYGSENNYNNDYNLTIEEFINYLDNDILKDKRFTEFITEEDINNIKDGKKMVNDAKEVLIGNNYNRVVLNTKYAVENEETFNFIKNIKNDLNKDDIYVIGNSPMAYDISQTFASELNLITILTIIFIFVVVLITFKSFIIPIILVILIQTAVFLTMGILSFEGGSVYFIALLIVQSILMGATIDYAILYTSYYVEHRKDFHIKEAMINAYNSSINTIITSSSILTIVTLIVGHFSSAIASKICITISQGTICSTILILLILPELISSLDRFIIKRK